MRVLIADFETTPFDYSKTENYQLFGRFCCFKEVYTNKKWTFIVENNNINPIINFIKNIASLNNPCRIYFHNLRFDIAFLYDLLPSKDFKYEVIFSGSKIIQFRIFKEYKRLKKNNQYRIERKTFLDIRDSFVILLSSVEKIGKSLGFPKLEVDYFMKEITQEYIDYCYRDIEVIEKALFNVIDVIKQYYDYEIKFSNLPLTLPSLAKRVLHHILVRKYGKKILNRIYDNYCNDYEQEIRNYYYGGRVEVFDFNICYNGFYNDFNSHYPAIMKENEFPLAPYCIIDCIDSEKCYLNWKNNKNIFGALCEVIENSDIPLLANKINGKLLFCNGKKTVFLFRKEIEYLLKNKQKVRILKLYSCSGYLPIFREFVDIAFSIKKKYNSDSFEYWFSKIFMNSLYGKFAEKREKEKVIIIKSLKGMKESDIRKCDFTEKGILMRKKDNQFTLKINVFYSMMITALARLKLTKLIVKSDNPFYCDSDSIVSETLIENSKEIGHLAPEFTFTKFQALGCKEYVIEKKEIQENSMKKVNYVKMKGFGKLSYSDFDMFVSEYRDSKKQNRMIGFLESFNRRMPLNTILVFEKFKTGTYDKRWILKDLTTKPFDLDNDDYDKLIKNNQKIIKNIILSYKKE
jgi:hypothetical protein